MDNGNDVFPVCSTCGRVHARVSPLSQHDQLHQTCTAHLKNGNPCMAWRLKGINVCRRHGGATRRAREAGARRVAEEQARKTAARLGVPVSVDPAEAIVTAVHCAAGMVDFCLEQLVALDVDPPSPLDAELGRLTGAEVIQSVIVPTYFPPVAGRGSRGREPTGGAEAHIWWKLYNESLDRLVAYSKAAVAMGIDERRLMLDEAGTTQLLDAAAYALTAAGLTRDQEEKFRRALAERLRAPQPRLGPRTTG